MAEKKEKDEQRLREQHQQQLKAQEEQHRNMMEAKMDKLRREREAMKAQRDNTTGDIIKVMADMMKSRDQGLTQLTQAVIEIANRPPVVIEKDSGGGFLSIIPEAIKAIGSIFALKKT